MNLILFIPLILAFLQYYKSPMAKLFFLVAFILHLLAVVFSFSRAGFLGLVTVIMLSLWRFFFVKTKFPLILILLFVFTILIPFLPQEYWERIESISNFNDVSIKDRIDGILVGIQIILKYPFSGAGIGRWYLEYWPVAIIMPNINAKFSSTAHNLLIEVGAETGIMGLAFFILFIWSVFKTFTRSRDIFIKKDMKLLAVISEALSVGLAGFLICTMFAAASQLKIFWLIMGLSIVLQYLSQKSDEADYA